MAQWRRFLQGDIGYPPREIDNLSLKSKIERRRASRGNPVSDEDLGLHDKKDFYTLSVNFFRFFYDTYGCNQIVVQKYDTEVEQYTDRGMPLSPRPTASVPKTQPTTKVIEGAEFSVVYESLRTMDLLEDEGVTQSLRAKARRLLAMPSRQRAIEERELL